MPDEERSAALVECLQNLPLRATLSRSVVDARPQGIFLRREVRGLPGPETPLDGMLWDRRFRLKCSGVSEGLKIAPFGTENARRTVATDAGLPQSLVRPALAAEPALWSGEACLGLMSDPNVRTACVEAMPVAGPWAQFLPSFDFALARSLSALLGSATVLRLPFRSHNNA